jgi:hypothetical protein
MAEPDPGIDKLALALKYPDFHTWRDLGRARAEGGRWPGGEIVRLSDPEMKPALDEMVEKIKSDPEFARKLIGHVGTTDQGE